MLQNSTVVNKQTSKNAATLDRKEMAAIEGGGAGWGGGDAELESEV